MNVPAWIVILSVFVFLTGCAPEEPFRNPTEAVSHPTPTLQATAENTAQVSPSPPAAGDCSRGDHFDQIQSGGQVREYLLHVPATYKPEEPAALVLMFHGAGIGAKRFVDYTRFSTTADRERFLIVYPQGQGSEEEPFWDTRARSRDVQFVSDLIDHLQKRCRVDPKRIYASGHSNGGGMVNRLACVLADRIAAIGPVSGAYATGSCSPSRPIPVFSIHGTADNIVSYEGVPEWASAWAERNGCDPEPVEVVRNVLISERQWGNCEADADVILYTIQDLGHDWPSDLIDVGQTIWDFFEAHPLP
jgi:polyhydroxybutyrate depolymerase